MTTIAASPAPLWGPGCRALGVTCVALPWPGDATGNPYAADIPTRLRAGTRTMELLADRGADLMIDLGGAGLAFVEGPGGLSDLKLAHERLGLTLVSHFADPVPLLNRGLSWDVLLACLGSRSWVKIVADAPHGEELIRFGISRVAHLPPAAADYDYDTRPLDPSACTSQVRFLGDSGVALFAGTSAASDESILPGAAMNDAARAAGRLPFFTLYHEVDRLAALPAPDAAPAERAAKMAAYFAMKGRFAAVVCRGQRDRMVAVLAERFGRELAVCGRGWGHLPPHRAEPPPASPRAYVAALRSAAINVVIHDGWSESTITPHHFEVTAAGGFLLCGHHPQVARHFEIGVECETFRDEGELLTRIAYYLAHPEQRTAIAAAGQRRTLRHHLQRHRLEAILRIVGVEVPRGGTRDARQADAEAEAHSLSLP